MEGDGKQSDERLQFERPSAVMDTHRQGVGADADPGLGFAPAPAEAKRREYVRPSRSFRPDKLVADVLRTAQRDFWAEWERGTAFLFIPVLLAAGVVTYFALPTEPPFLPLMSASLALCTAATLARGRFFVRTGSVALLLFVAGIAVGKIETWRMSTKMLGSEISTHVTGRVAEIESLSSGRMRLTIDIMRTDRPHLRYAPDRIRVSARGIPPGLHVGDGVEGYVRMLPPTGPVRPGGYDFSFQSYFRGIGASGFFLSTPQKVDFGAPPLLVRLDVSLEYARVALADRIRTEIGGPEGEVAVALITGMQSGIPERIKEGLRVAGIAHVLAISGLHMALVAGIVMTFLRAAFALFPDFASRHPTKKYTAAAAIFAITFYLLISGHGVAAQRSYIMLAIMLLAIFFDRSAISMRNFSIAAIVVVVTVPHEVTGPSFQMSFAATAALIAAYSAWSEAKQRFPRLRPARRDRSRLGRAVAYGVTHVGGIAMTSFVAGGATALFAAWHFQRISPLGVAGNLATMPIVSFIVMPAMVAAMIAMPFGLDWPFFKIMGWGIGLFTRTAVALSHYSPFDAIGIIPPAMVVLMTLGFIILALTTTRLRFAGIPLLLAGLLCLPFRTRPDVLVSEEGRLVGLRLSDGRLTVNTNRPSAFDIENWSHAMMTRDLVKPGRERQSAMPTIAPEVPFSCTPTLCIAWNAGGAVVATATDASAAAEACPIANLIVIADATARNPCAPETTSGGPANGPPLQKPNGSSEGAETKSADAEGPVVITKRDLARFGAAAVNFRSNGRDGIVAAVSYAITTPYRPWHAERVYSRSARGLGPYRWKKRGGRSLAHSR